MAPLSAYEVFTPGSFPKHTYVGQRGRAYETELRDSLAVKGILTSILGPSKSGKTVLVDKVVGDNALKISGSDIWSINELWQRILARIGVNVRRSEGKEESRGLELSTGGVLKVAIPFVVEGGGEAGVRRERGHAVSESKEYAPAGMDEAVSGLQARNKVLVIDDFHYVERSVQTELAHQLKEAIQRGLPILVLAVPHRGSDPIRANVDLRGRVRPIDVGYWGESDLAAIGGIGFPLTGLAVAPEDISRLAKEALGSPQLMQALCLQTCMYFRERGVEAVDTRLGADGVNSVARATSSLADAKMAFNMLKTGPKMHGVERAIYSFKGGGSGDTYVVVLRALSDEPAVTSLRYDEIRNRVAAVVDGYPLRLDNR